MPRLSIPCPHCSMSTQIDSDRLPDQPAFFACPSCKGKVSVDKRQLLGGGSTTTAAQAAPVPATGTVPRQPVEIGSTAPADRRFPNLPADARLPSGIILGEDDAVIEQVREALAALGSNIDQVSSADTAREAIINEQPDLCIYVAGALPAPPYPPMARLTGLPPTLRRRLYLALIADNLKTLDGTAAFMYQVNMVLQKEDLPQLGAALHGGIDYHERLYRQYFRAVEMKGPI